MRSYTNNCGAGGEYLGFLHRTGFDGARVGFLIGNDPKWIHFMKERFVKRNMSPLFLLPFGGEDHRSVEEELDFVEWFCSDIQSLGLDLKSTTIEVGNEPRLFGRRWEHDPEGLGRAFDKAIVRIRRWTHNVTILSPAISNIDPSGIEYFSKLLSAIEQRDFALAFHHYPGRKYSAFVSALKFAELFKIVATTLTWTPKFWLTETGLSQVGEKPRGTPLCWFNKKFRLETKELADFAEFYWKFWRNTLDGIVWYQLTDGQGLLDFENFGLLDKDLEPKPELVERFKQIHEGGKD